MRQQIHEYHETAASDGRIYKHRKEKVKKKFKYERGTRIKGRRITLHDRAVLARSSERKEGRREKKRIRRRRRRSVVTCSIFNRLVATQCRGCLAGADSME
jgi:hypothetical protein